MTSATSPEAISPLRARMIEDMTVRNFGADTQRDYIRCVKKLAAFLGRSPDTATAEDLRRFQIDLVGSGATPSTANSTVTALRFFFSTTVDQPDRTRHLALVHQPRKIPVVLSPEEVVRLLEMTPGVKYQTAFSVAYGAGLRVSEVAALKVSDIDSDRMRLRVERGKGSKDREAMLSERLLEQLRDWWRFARPTTWLFAGQDPINHISTRQLNRVCTWRRKPPGSPSVSHRIRSGIHSQLISWSRVLISVSFRFCWGTPSLRRRRSTPRSQATSSAM
jgi:integrase/recombinase XerD